MLRFYKTLLGRWMTDVRQFMTPIRFWAWAAGVLAAGFLPSYLLSMRWAVWLLPVAVICAGIYVLLLANYKMYEEIQSQLSTLKVQQAAEDAKGGLLEELRFVQARGIELRSEMARTFIPERHTPRKRTWQERVLSVIERGAPKYKNQMLLEPPGRRVERNATERDLAIMDMNEWLHKLEDVIRGIDT